MSDEPEEGFTFRDRRGSHAIPTPAPAPAPVAQPEPEDEIEEEDDAPLVLPPGLPDPFASVQTPPPATIFMPGMGEVPASAGAPEDEGEVPDIFMQLYEFMMFLRSMAALRLGVIPNPSTNRFEKDLEQARVAIDTVTFLAQQLEPVLPAEERLPLRAMVTDLRMRYVEETKR